MECEKCRAAELDLRQSTIYLYTGELNPPIDNEFI